MEDPTYTTLSIDSFDAFVQTLSGEVQTNREFVVSTGEAGARAFHEAVEEKVEDLYGEVDIKSEYTKEQNEELRIKLNKLANGE